MPGGVLTEGEVGAVAGAKSRLLLGRTLAVGGSSIASVAFSADSGTAYAAGIHVPLQRYVVDPDRVV